MTTGDWIALGLLVATIAGVVVLIIVNWTALEEFFEARPRVVMASWFALGLVTGAAISAGVTYRIMKGGGG